MSQAPTLSGSMTGRIPQIQKLHAEAIALMQQSDEIHSKLAQIEAQQRELMLGGTVSSAPVHVPTSAPTATTKGKAAKTAKAPGTTKATKSKNGNEQPLREVVWEVVNRKENSGGLTVAEVVDIIETEKSWKSTADNISPMVQTQIYNFKGLGKLKRRAADKKYYLV